MSSPTRTDLGQETRTGPRYTPITQAQVRNGMRKYMPDVLEKERERVRKYRGYSAPDGWYAEQLKVQKGLCAICGNPPGEDASLHADHDHATGAMRGLLCGRCNTGLGMFRDNPAFLISAVEYLRLFTRPSSDSTAD